MSLTSPWFQSFPFARLFALFVVPVLTAHTLVELAQQVQRSKNIQRALWILGGSVAIGLGLCCTMELSAGQVAGTSPMALPDHLLQAGFAFAGCVWTLVTLARRQLRTGWVVASSLALALGFSTMGNVAMMFRLKQNITADELSVISFVVAAATSYVFLKIGALAKQLESSWSPRGLAATTAMGLLLAGFLSFNFQIAKAGSLHDAQDYLTGGLPLTALFFGTVAVLVSAQAATAISKQNFLRNKEAQKTYDEQRIREVLSDQRVTRLQNEALLQEVQERQRAEGQLRYAAFHDTATGLTNRYALTETLTGMLTEQQTYRRPQRTYAILVNLDDLKSISSVIGRSTADKVLLEVAQQLQRFASANDLLSRLGDDEFLLLVKHAPTPDHALRKAQLMLASVEETISLAGVVVNLCASVGLCEINTGHHRAEDVFRDVDMAVQMAKRNGGKRCSVFVPGMREEALDAQQRKMELKTAVEREEFVLHYQPLVDMRDRTIYGMEALVRWNHPTRGVIQPGTFIPLAEETGQILNIGSWTLRAACREFAQLQAKSPKDLLLSVNVSPRQLFETPFLKILTEVLEETDMPPRQLQLEVTESIFIKDAPSIGAMLQAIRALGVKIAFDDFGTGYSSLSYLTRYPIDTLKVDQSFVRGMNQSTGGENLVLFMLGLATEFNMSVTAEGVEEVEHETALLRQGCLYAQGYLYSRPVPLATMMDLLQHGLKIDKPHRVTGRRRHPGKPFLTSTTAFRPSGTN